MTQLIEMTMQPIQISDLDLVSRDDRGETFRIDSERHGPFLLCYRRAGSSSGRHYHPGARKYKNPEILFLLSGEADLRWKDMQSGQEGVLNLHAPVRVEIPAWIWHELRARTDCSFWEMNSLDDVRHDSIRVEPGPGGTLNPESPGKN